MPLLIAHAVEHNPQYEDRAGHNGESMPLKKRSVPALAKPDFQSSPQSNSA
jgi:hypothetical protein